MEEKLSTVENVLNALPAVQAAVREEIAQRIANGEKVGGIDAKLEAKLKQRKLELLAKHFGRTGVNQSEETPARRPRARRSAA
jgi:hypothetical protein